jgi:Na+/H+ antiporter NhaD/arsenite permease-like protein
LDLVVGGVFVLVYTGMVLGELPRLRVDRAGIALVGAIVLVATGRLTTTAAWGAIDVPTIILLVAMMIVSGQLRLAGFYTLVTRRLSGPHSPTTLLALVVVASGVLSAVLANDIVCLAMAPLLIDVCARRRLDPIPYLLALACASNVGSAATLIGNPQNMLIGQALQLSFTRYLVEGGPPALVGLLLVWLVIAWIYRGQWTRDSAPDDAHAIPVDRWQVTKGLAVVVGIVLAFLFTPWPRDVVALVGAGALIVSRKMASREMLSQIDWHLLVLFVGLFVVNRAVAQAGLVSYFLMMSRMSGLDLTNPASLFAVAAVLSNIVSNVPAVMLLLPAARADIAGPVLALASTFAGNLVVAGSVANIIVVDQAKRRGVAIKGKTHWKVGIPVTLLTLAVAALWLWFLSAPG